MYRRNFHLKNILLRDMVSKNPLVLKVANVDSVTLYMSFKERKCKFLFILPFIFALAVISRQKIFIHRSRKHVVSLQIQKNSVIGISCRIRGKNCITFLENFIVSLLCCDENIVANQGSFDKFGSLHFNMKKLTALPEFDNEHQHFDHNSLKPMGLFSFDIIIQSTLNSKKEIALLLSGLQIPSRKMRL